MLYGIIAGTGIDDPNTNREWNSVKTPFGEAVISTAKINNKEVLFMRRHGIGMNTPPHLINHKANLYAMKNFGVKYIIATAAVGSLKLNISPGMLAILTDFIDFSRNRINTIYDFIGNELNHTDFSYPYSNIINEKLIMSAIALNCIIIEKAVYISVDGPRYETPAEINMFRSWGADVIGMTGAPEAIIAKEFGMEYSSLAIITNYAAGIQNTVLSHNDVIDIVAEKRQLIWSIISNTLIDIS